MSRITFDRVRPFSVRDAAQINSLFAAFEAASASVDTDNLAEEGLDRRAFGVRPCERLGTITVNSRTAIAPAGEWTQFSMGTSFRTSSIGALRAVDVLRITSVVRFTSIAGANPLGIPVGETIQMRHLKNDSGSTAAIEASTGKLTGASGAGNRFGHHGTLAIESWITVGAIDLQWVELQYQLSGSDNAYAGHGLLVVDVFRSTRRL